MISLTIAGESGSDIFLYEINFYLHNSQKIFLAYNQKIVIPAKAGIHAGGASSENMFHFIFRMDPGLRRDDNSYCARSNII
jgi:hypothetical protein